MQSSTRNCKKQAFTIIAFIISTIVFFWISIKTDTYMDNVWSFGFARMVYDGLIPYNDFNMIVFPGHAYLFSMFTKNITIYFFAMSVVNMIVLFMSLKLASNIIQKVTVFFFFIFMNYKIFLDYNMTMLFFLIVSFYILMKYCENGKPYQLFLIGLSMSMAFISKQSVPGILIILITPFILAYTIKQKKFKDFLLYAIGGIIPVGFVLFMAIKDGYLSNMIDFTIKGISNIYSVDDPSMYIIFAFIFFIISEFALFLTYRQSSDIKYIFIMIYILAGFFICIPLADITHVNLFMYMLIVFLSYVSLKNIAAIFMMSIVLFYPFVGEHEHNLIEKSIMQRYYYLTNPVETINSGKLEGYHYVPEIETIKNFKNEHPDDNIVRIDPNTMYFTLYFGEYQGYADLVINGNLGTEGNKILKEIILNADYVIWNKNLEFWQREYEDALSLLKTDLFEPIPLGYYTAYKRVQ